MNVKFQNYFYDPLDNETLSLYIFEQTGNNVISGLFINKKTGIAYMLNQGVATFLPNSFSIGFLNLYAEKIKDIKSKIPNLKTQIGTETNSWSFSLEWEAHSKLEMNTTWGMSLQSRYDQFLLETQTRPEELQGKLILDAGCGNGQHTEYLSGKGPIVIGIDYSTSVFQAEKMRKSENCCYVRGNLMTPPFRNETFDIIISNGVLHHTPNTESTFKSVAKTVKNNGKFYLWLYSRKGSIFWRFKRRVFDYLRIVICRMPDAIKKLSVNLIAALLYYCYLIGGKKLDKKTLIIDIYDSVTPRWRYYHTPEEISKWYFDEGFGPLSLTNWNTKYGFGAVAIKSHPEKTPGEDFYIKPQNR